MSDPRPECDGFGLIYDVTPGGIAKKCPGCRLCQGTEEKLVPQPVNLPPKVMAEREMTLPEALKWAMEGQTRLIDAEVKICIWETERVVKQARANPTWETCFHHCLWALHRAWEQRDGSLHD